MARQTNKETAGLASSGERERESSPLPPPLVANISYMHLSTSPTGCDSPITIDFDEADGVHKGKAAEGHVWKTASYLTT